MCAIFSPQSSHSKCCNTEKSALSGLKKDLKYHHYNEERKASRSSHDREPRNVREHYGTSSGSHHPA